MSQFNYSIFSEYIMNKIGYSGNIRDASKEIGVSASTLSRVMNGKEAKLITYLKICDWLEMQITYFITENNQSNE